MGSRKSLVKVLVFYLEISSQLITLDQHSDDIIIFEIINLSTKIVILQIEIIHWKITHDQKYTSLNVE